MACSTIDDVIDVIQEEAEEDILRLGGVGDEELSDNVIETAKSRWPWLFVNTLTALIASTVIGFLMPPSSRWWLWQF